MTDSFARSCEGHSVAASSQPRTHQPENFLLPMFLRRKSGTTASQCPNEPGVDLERPLRRSARRRLDLRGSSACSAERQRDLSRSVPCSILRAEDLRRSGRRRGERLGDLRMLLARPDERSLDLRGQITPSRASQLQRRAPRRGCLRRGVGTHSRTACGWWSGTRRGPQRSRRPLHRWRAESQRAPRPA